MIKTSQERKLKPRNTNKNFHGNTQFVNQIKVTNEELIEVTIKEVSNA